MNEQAPLVVERLLAERQWLCALARSLVRDENAADDLEQDAWVASMKKPPISGASPRGWLATVVRNRARDNHRRTMRRATREARAARPEAQRSAAELAEQADTQRRVIEAVLALEQPYRTTVLMRYFDELDVREIAARMDTTPSTVRTRLSRAMARLRAALGQAYGNDVAWKRALVPFLATGSSSHGSSIRRSANEDKRGQATSSGGRLGFALALASLLAVGSVFWWAPWQSDVSVERAPTTASASADVSPPRLEGGARDNSLEAYDANRSEESAARERAGREGGAKPPSNTSAQKSGGVIRVVVLDGQSSVVEGADVLLIDRSDAKHPIRGALLGRATSDAEGRATFEGIAPKGNLHVRAAYQETSAITGEFDGSQPPRDPIRVVLGPSRVIAGRVINDDGHAIADATVFVHARFEGAIIAIAIQPTDDLGAFRIAGLPESLLNVGEEKPASIEVRAKGYGECWHELSNTNENLGQLTLKLSKSRTIEGRIVNERGHPIADAGLEFPDSVGGTSTNSEGRFRAGRLPQRTVKLRINSTQHAPRLIDVPFEGQFKRNLGDIVLHPGKPIAGIVLDKDGNPLSGALVAISSDAVDQIVRQGESDEHGRFRFEHFGEGEHKIYLFTDSGDKATRTGVSAGEENVEIRLGGGK